MPIFDSLDKQAKNERDIGLLRVQLQKLEVELKILQEDRAKIIEQQKTHEKQQPQDVLPLEQFRRDTLRLQKSIEVKFREAFYCRKRLDKLSGRKNGVL